MTISQISLAAQDQVKMWRRHVWPHQSCDDQGEQGWLNVSPAALSLITAPDLSWGSENPINRSREWMGSGKDLVSSFVLIIGQRRWLLFAQVDVSDIPNVCGQPFTNLYYHKANGLLGFISALLLFPRLMSPCGLICCLHRHVDLICNILNAAVAVCNE